MVAMQPSEASTSPSGRPPWHSQMLQPLAGTPGTHPLAEEAGSNETRIQPPRTPSE
ncbi:hypothetical protein FS837_003601, partial [Tulasnella sp. UAMH 9824]